MAIAATAEQEAIAEIAAYIRRNGGGYSAWYVGIAANPRDRLFVDHSVTEKGGWWIHCDCGNDAAARRVENAFLNAGCQGGAGGGDRDTRFVYAYRITLTTRE